MTFFLQPNPHTHQTKPNQTTHHHPTNPRTNQTTNNRPTVRRTTVAHFRSYEDTFEPEKATESARTLGRLAPGAAHFQHMPGHIYYLIGDYAEACHAFSNSTKLDEAYFQQTGVLPANNCLLYTSPSPRDRG